MKQVSALKKEDTLIGSDLSLSPTFSRSMETLVGPPESNDKNGRSIHLAGARWGMRA